jgi:hypothetical protein
MSPINSIEAGMTEGDVNKLNTKINKGKLQDYLFRSPEIS